VPDIKVSLDSLKVLEEAMRYFFVKAMIEKSVGVNANWKAVDAALLHAAAMAEKVAHYRHAKLSAVRLAGEIKQGPPDGARLDELLERIRAELNTLAPILNMEIVREPDESRAKGALTVTT
jgi:hypothetical protein